VRGLIHVGAWDGKEYLRRTVDAISSHGGRTKWHDDRPLLLIEPQKQAFAKLRRNFRRYETATCVRCALGAERGEGLLHTAHPTHSSSLLAPAETMRIFPGVIFDGSEPVRIDTLDHLISAMDAKGRYSEMVLDVQGYELEVLRGAVETLPDIDWIMTEANAIEMYEGCALLGDLDAFLEPLGFTRTETDMYAPEGSSGDVVYER
jgi:FkbM family methyltransferase